MRLVLAGVLKAEVFASKEVGTTVPPGLTLDQQAGWVDAHSDYVYAGAGINLARVNISSTILAYDKDGNRGGEIMSVLFADGHIEFMSMVRGHHAIMQGNDTKAP